MNNCIEINIEQDILEEDPKPYGISERCLLFSKSVVAVVQNAHYDRVFISMYDQLVRSATSIGANVVEAKAGSSKKDWIKFLIIALKSANETKYWLELIKDTIAEDQQAIKVLIDEVDTLSKIIGKIITNAQRNDVGDRP